MKRILWVVALGACEHGQSPSSANIRVSELRCMHDDFTVQFEATLDVTLADAQQVRLTFLPDIDGVQFSREATWQCGTWDPVDINRWCSRDSSAQDTQTVMMMETNTVGVGTLPASFGYTAVASITDSAAQDIESVLLTDACGG